ncbi:MAG: hypothetical protein QOK04_19, partial [Solirubrobacteraceae bacterium]|nr:hypothetical protein [Solirubrobacteraceae bacterium]
MHEHHISASVSAGDSPSAPSEAEMRAAWRKVVGRRS